MPGKHVRFSTEDTFLPSSYSSASSSSSSGHHFPPHVVQHHARHSPRRSYTDSSAGKSRAHSLIAYSETPYLIYDISLHPSSLSTHHQGVSSARLLEPAVYPPQPTISIISSHVPWTIDVPASNGRYVTVADALSALYRGGRMNVTRAEFHTLGATKLMRRVTEAYEHRCSRLKGHHGYEEEKAKGVKRVDFLMGATKLRGLSPTNAPDVWRLHVSTHV